MPIRKSVGWHPYAARCRMGMRQLRVIRIGSKPAEIPGTVLAEGPGTSEVFLWGRLEHWGNPI